jgi:hypothetical protein
MLTRNRSYLKRNKSEAKKGKQGKNPRLQATTFRDRLESFPDLNDKITRWKHDQGS